MSLTFTQAVAQVSASLSEGVSKFTLFVVTAKGKNAAAPAGLSGAVDSIGGQCAFANALSQGYSDYPSIQSRIQSEAAGLDSTQKNLVSTCRSMSGTAGSPQLAASWQRLSDCCQSIGNAVIALLEILYQAEVERIYLTNEKAQTAIASAVAYPGDKVESDQQAFADRASDSATYINHLAQFLGQRAQAEESPVHQEDLNNAAHELMQLAEKVVNQANDCMDEPDDAQRLSVFQGTNNEASSVAAGIIAKIRALEGDRNLARIPNPVQSSPAPVQRFEAPARTMERVASVTETSAPAPVKTAAPPAQKSPSPAPKMSGPPGVSQVKAPAPAASKPRSQPAPRGQPSGRGGKPTSMGDVVDSARSLAAENQGGIMGGSSELLKELENLTNAARDGNGSALLTAARNVANISAKFSQDVRTAAQSCNNVKAKDDLLHDTKLLRDMCTQLKILASVKASLSEEGQSMDKDEQLIYLTSNLVNTWKNAGDHLEIANLKH